MDLDRVHITPVSPDAHASERYTSPEDQTPSKQEERREPEKQKNDRLEISDRGRQTYKAHAVLQEIDFARKALDRMPLNGDAERASQLAARIESGYYTTPGVLEQIAARMVPRG